MSFPSSDLCASPAFQFISTSACSKSADILMASTLGKRQLVATLLPKKKEKEKKGPMGRAFTKQSMKAGVSPQPDDLRKLRISWEAISPLLGSAKSRSLRRNTASEEERRRRRRRSCPIHRHPRRLLAQTQNQPHQESTESHRLQRSADTTNHLSKCFSQSRKYD